jgi:hypothetical protein
MEIARRNIFDEIIGKAGSIYDSAIMTCFSFDPLYFIQYYLPKLNAINISNILVLIDAGQYDEACEEFIRYQELSGRSIQLNFSPVRVVPSFHGVFHPKIAFLVGPRQCTALIGSGNLTYGGMSYNNEVWNAFSANNIGADEAPIIYSVWNYLFSLVSNGQDTVREQLAWMTTYSECLKSIETSASRGQKNFYFLVNRREKGIGQQLLDIIGERPVKDLTIVSPYFDKDGAALISLIDGLNPTSVLCLGDEETGTCPSAMKESYRQIITFKSISGKDLEARTHAKIIQIHTEDSTYLLSGSMNATTAGLGFGSVKNDEAGILIIQEGIKEYITELGISPGKDIILCDNYGAKRQSTRKDSIEVAILSCELWNGEYIVKLNRPLSDVDFQWKDAFGNEGPALHFESIPMVVKVKYELLQGATSLAIVRGDRIISNRILILEDNIVRNYCPDKAIKLLSRLMDFSRERDWDSNITQLLSYVTFEEEPLPKIARRATVRAATTSSLPQDTIIDRKDFAADPLESDSARINIRILDFFFKYISSDDDPSIEIEEEYSTAQIDRGEATGDEDSDSQKARKESSNKKKLSELDDYLNRISRHYDKLCSRFDTAQQPLLLDDETDIRQVAKSKAYSSCLIAIALLFKKVRNNESSKDKCEENLIQKIMNNILGRFLMIYRDGFIECDGYMANIVKMKQNIFVYSLILISHFEWDYGKYNPSKLLVLNLLDMFKDDSEHLDKAISLFKKSIDTAHIYINRASLDAIFKCFSLYQSNKVITTLVGEAELPAVIYKKRLGFLLCSEVQHVEEPHRNSLEVVIAVYSPGFRNLLPVLLHNGNKLPIFK